MREKTCLARDYCAPRIADCCRAVLGVHQFNKLVSDVVIRASQPSRLHRRLASLPIQFYVSSSFDTLLEKAVEEERGLGAARVLSIKDEDQWIMIPRDPKNAWILRIHGSVSRAPNGFIITEDDFLGFSDRYSGVIEGLSRILAEKSVLFVGYSFADWDLLPVLRIINRAIEHTSSNMYFVGGQPRVFNGRISEIKIWLASFQPLNRTRASPI